MAKGNFGERLKRERELREVTLQEITSATRIGPRFLEALENEDWEKLPGGVFNRGFVRSIARYLGLDEEAFLGEYDLAHGAQVPATEEPPQHSELPPPRWLPAVLILGALVILAAIVLGRNLHLETFRQSPQQSSHKSRANHSATQHARSSCCGQDGKLASECLGPIQCVTPARLRAARPVCLRQLRHASAGGC